MKYMSCGESCTTDIVLYQGEYDLVIQRTTALQDLVNAGVKRAVISPWRPTNVRAIKVKGAKNNLRNYIRS